MTRVGSDGRCWIRDEVGLIVVVVLSLVRLVEKRRDGERQESVKE